MTAKYSACTNCIFS